MSDADTLITQYFSKGFIAAVMESGVTLPKDQRQVSLRVKDRADLDWTIHFGPTGVTAQRGVEVACSGIVASLADWVRIAEGMSAFAAFRSGRLTIEGPSKSQGANLAKVMFLAPFLKERRQSSDRISRVYLEYYVADHCNLKGDRREAERIERDSGGGYRHLGSRRKWLMRAARSGAQLPSR